MRANAIRVVDNQVVAGDETSNSHSRFHTFPSMTQCSDGSFICTTLVGTTKSGPDGRIQVFRSDRNLRNWTRIPSPTRADEQAHPDCGYLMCHIAELSPGRLLALYMRSDRFNPDEPLFHPTTSGMQRTVLRLSNSENGGQSWSAPRDMDYQLPDLIAPGQITRLPDGSLGMPFEVWHEWDKGFREGPSTRMILTRDEGQTWPDEGIIARPPDRGTVYGDPRLTILPNGNIAMLLWVYDIKTEKDQPIHRTESADNGRTWSAPVSTGIQGQIASPVWLHGDLMIAVYQKRFGERTGLRAILSNDAGRTWQNETDTLIWGVDQKLDTSNPFAGYDAFTFGYSRALKLADNSVLVSFWSGNGAATNIRILKLAVETP